MMQAQLIADYERLLEQAQCLLECAKKSDWDGIFSIKSQGLIDEIHLRRAEAKAELDEAGQQRKLELISQILELEKQVNSFLLNRQNDLGQLMKVNRKKSDLNSAYRASSNTVIPMSHYLYQKK